MKRALLALLAVLAFCGTASAQGYFFNQPVINSQGLPAPGANAAVCTTILTTAASVSGNLATLTMASNPLTAGFTPGSTIVISNFTGSDTYLNGNYQVAAVNSTAILFSLVHANATASSNGNVVQQGSAETACAPLATIYTDQTLTTSSPNPFLADGLGNLQFWATPAQYYGFVYGPTVDPTLSPLSIPCMPGSSCGGGGSGSCPGMSTMDTAQLYNDAGSCAGEIWLYDAPNMAITNYIGSLPQAESVGTVTTMTPTSYDVQEQYLHCEDCWETLITTRAVTVDYFSYDTMDESLGFLKLDGVNNQLTIAAGDGVTDDKEVVLTAGSSDGRPCLTYTDTFGFPGGDFCAADTNFTGRTTELSFYGNDGSGNAIVVEAPVTIGSAPVPLCLPAVSGTMGQVLVTDGGTTPCQQLSWASGGAGSVASVAGISGFIGVTDPTSTAQLTLNNPITAQLIFGGNAFPQFNGGFGCATGSAPSATSGFDILYCNSSDGNLYLSNNGGGFGRVLTGTVGVPDGGLGLTAITADNLLCGNGTSAPTFIPPVSNGDVLTDNGPGSCPTFQAPAGGSSTALSGITAATTASTISDGDNNIRFNWHLTTNGGVAMYFGESSASTATGSYLLRSSTLASSTADPFRADNAGNGIVVSPTGELGVIGTGSIDFAGLTDFPTACTNQFVTEVNASSIGCTGVNLANATQATGTLPLAHGGTAQTAAPVKRAEFVLASCNLQASPSAGASGLPSSGGMTPTCKTDGTNGTVQATLAAAHSNVVYFTWNLPADWVSFNSATLEFTTTDTTSGHTIIFSVATACTQPNGGNVDTPAYNAANAFTTTTIGGGATANALYSTSAASVTGTGCTAGSILHMKLTRSGSDTSTDSAVALTGGLVLAYNGAYN